MSSVDNTGDTETEEHVNGKLNILEFGMVATSGNGTVTLRTEEERAGEKEWSLLSTVTAEETLEGGTLLEGTVGVVDPPVLKDITIRGHVSVAHRHADLSVVTVALIY